MWKSEEGQHEFGSIWPLWHGDPDVRNRRQAVRRLSNLAEEGFAPRLRNMVGAFYAMVKPQHGLPLPTQKRPCAGIGEPARAAAAEPGSVSPQPIKQVWGPNKATSRPMSGPALLSIPFGPVEDGRGLRKGAICTPRDCPLAVSRPRWRAARLWR